MKMVVKLPRVTFRHPEAKVVRSYVLEPYQMVTDHRTGVKSVAVLDVLDGNIDALLMAAKA